MIENNEKLKVMGKERRKSRVRGKKNCKQAVAKKKKKKKKKKKENSYKQYIKAV